ncbi:hypothetical protein LMIY3S_00273 [Labrys miyagiensis]
MYRAYDAAGTAPLVRMGFKDRVHLIGARSRRYPCVWFSRPYLTDIAPYLVLCPSHIVDDLTPAARLSGHGRNSINLSFCQQCPGNAGCLVRQGHDHQHRWLTGEHPCQPRASRHAFAFGPAHNSRIGDNRSRLRVRSPMREVRPLRGLPPVDFCLGVRPTHAAKSRPDRNVVAGGARVSSAGPARHRQGPLGRCRVVWDRWYTVIDLENVFRRNGDGGEHCSPLLCSQRSICEFPDENANASWGPL